MFGFLQFGQPAVACSSGLRPGKTAPGREWGWGEGWHTPPSRKFKGGESSRNSSGPAWAPQAPQSAISLSVLPFSLYSIHFPVCQKLLGKYPQHARLQKQEKKTLRKPQERLKLAHVWLRDLDTPESLCFRQRERGKPVLFANSALGFP